MTFTCCRRNTAHIAHSRVLRAAQEPSAQRLRRHPGAHPGRAGAWATRRPAGTEATPVRHTGHRFHEPPTLRGSGPAWRHAGLPPLGSARPAPLPAALTRPQRSLRRLLRWCFYSHRPQTALWAGGEAAAGSWRTEQREQPRAGPDPHAGSSSHPRLRTNLRRQQLQAEPAPPAPLPPCADWQLSPRPVWPIDAFPLASNPQSRPSLATIGLPSSSTPLKSSPSRTMAVGRRRRRALWVAQFAEAATPRGLAAPGLHLPRCRGARRARSDWASSARRAPGAGLGGAVQAGTGPSGPLRSNHRFVRFG